MLPGRHPTRRSALAEETWLMKYRSAPPRLTCEAPTSLDELWALVSRGKAIAILPLFMISRLQGDGVRAIPLARRRRIPVALACLRGDTRPVVRELRASLACHGALVELAPRGEQAPRRRRRHEEAGRQAPRRGARAEAPAPPTAAITVAYTKSRTCIGQDPRPAQEFGP